jgi:Protein of unknown function (DUF419).
MVPAPRFRALVGALPDVNEQNHFDRTAWRVRRIFASLAPDGLSANLLLTPDQQRFRVELHPGVLAPIPGGFGARGWTTVDLSTAEEALVETLLAEAHANGARR